MDQARHSELTCSYVFFIVLLPKCIIYVLFFILSIFILFVYVFSELLSGNDQVAISQNKPDFIDANKKLTGISESMHIPITSGCQNDSGLSPFRVVHVPAFYCSTSCFYQSAI